MGVIVIPAGISMMSPWPMVGPALLLSGESGHDERATSGDPTLTRIVGPEFGHLAVVLPHVFIDPVAVG